MRELSPLSVKNMPYERVLAMPPCTELDMYIFANIIEGPEELLEDHSIGQLPSFSRRFADCQMLLIKAGMELGPLTVTIDPTMFAEASRLGFMIRKTPCVVWQIKSSEFTGYGRNFEEALCKLLIVAKHGKDK